MHYPINIINLSLMEKSRETDQQLLVEDNIFDLLARGLVADEYRFVEKDTSVSVLISDVDSGQSITVWTRNSEEENSTIIRVEYSRNSNNTRPVITAIQTKTFIDVTNEEPIYLTYFPHSDDDEFRHMKNNIGWPNLVSIIKLAIKAQESIE